MTTQFAIRPALPADIPTCLQLDHSLQTDVIWQMQLRDDPARIQVTFQTLRLPRPIRVEYPREVDERRLDLQTGQGVLVAEAEGTLLGYAQIGVNRPDHSAWLRNLVVGAPFRRHRIGRALLAQAKLWAKGQSANHITLETTLKSYPAIQFMLAQGLLFCGFNDRYYASQDIAVFFGQNL